MFQGYIFNSQRNKYILNDWMMILENAVYLTILLFWQFMSQEKYKSTQAESNIVTAVLPLLPLAKSYVGASLLAELMVNKYVNHLPFYRQIQMFKQLGISLPAATISDWFSQTADLLRPLYYRLKELVLSSDYIQVDESTLPIVNEEKHKMVKGYIWMAGIELIITWRKTVSGHWH